MPPEPRHYGRYQVTEPLKVGGMATLYVAQDPNVSREVVIKVPAKEFRTPDHRAQFLREARALGLLNHPNIVQVYDSGEDHGEPFLVMEYIRGKTLADELRIQTPYSLIWRLEVIEQLCAGLAYAHEHKVIHRDVKPANLMITEVARTTRPTLHIVDFGIARIVEDQAPRSKFRGLSINYASPEHFLGRTDAQSDVFSAGLVAYELLTLRPAVPDATEEEVQERILQKRVPARPLAIACPFLNASLVSLVSSMMAIEKHERPRDLHLVAEQVKRIREGLSSDEVKRFGTFIVPGPTIARSEAIRELIQAAEAALAAGNYDGALKHCHELQELDAKSAEGLRDRVVAERRRAEVERDTVNGRNWLTAARKYLDEKRLDEATGFIEKVLLLNVLREETEHLQNEVRRARLDEERARKRLEEFKAFTDRAKEHFDAKRFDEARVANNAALARFPDDADALRLRGILDEKLKVITERIPPPEPEPTEPNPVRRWIVSGAMVAVIALVGVGGWYAFKASQATAEDGRTQGPIDPGPNSPPDPERKQAVEPPIAGSRAGSAGGGIKPSNENQTTGTKGPETRTPPPGPVLPSNEPVQRAQALVDQGGDADADALKEITTALKTDPADRRFDAMLATLLARARGRTQNAKTAAASATGTKAYADALGKEQQAAKTAPGQTSEAIQLLSEATGLYVRAETEAKDAALRLAQDLFDRDADSEALRAVSSGRQTYPSDQRFSDLLTRLLTRAQAKAKTAKDAVAPAALKTTEYAGAIEKEKQAVSQVSAGRGLDAIPLFWAAADLFRTAVPPVDANAGIRTALTDYRTAYESKDVALLRKVYPGFGKFSELERSFADMASVAVAMNPLAAEIRIAADGTAVATCLHQMTMRPKVGPVQTLPASRAEFQLRKIGSAWIIERVVFK